MSVMPGSLDYLYYNGVLDHIPYEAYETIPATPSGMGLGAGAGVGVNGGVNGLGMSQGANYGGAQGMMNSQISQYSSPMAQSPSSMMNAEQYINAAKQGNAFNSYNATDTFVRRGDTNIKQGQDYDFERSAFGADGKSFREGLTDAAKQVTGSNTSTFVKGLLAGGIMIGTLVCILKGKKKPPVNEVLEESAKTGFWAKLNPLKWFKK